MGNLIKTRIQDRQALQYWIDAWTIEGCEAEWAPTSTRILPTKLAGTQARSNAAQVLYTKPSGL